MPSTFTANLNLEVVPRGDQVDAWASPENSNWELVDSAVSGFVTIPLTNLPVTLSQAQYKCRLITLTGALSDNIAITLPAISRVYTINNLCTNSTAFYVTLGTTVTGGRITGIPPGTRTTISTDGTNTDITNFGDTIGDFRFVSVGTTADWILASTREWYLLCDGTTFSSADYPALTERIGGTTLPNIPATIDTITTIRAF